MRIIFLGCTAYSEKMLSFLIGLKEHQVVAIFSIPKEFKISYSLKPVINTNYANLKPYADRLKIPFFEINSVKGSRLSDYKEIVKSLSADLILVLGWYYKVPQSIRILSKLGAWGIHASLLPNYAGGAPLVWAMIEGQTKTGVTLFRLSDGIDDGDIIEQSEFSIEPSDTIRDVYEKAVIASKKIIKKVLCDENYKLIFKPQDKSKIKVYPQRTAEDGKIDWSWSADKINRFIKAQTKPYPGAWTVIENKKIIIWDAEIFDLYE